MDIRKYHFRDVDMLMASKAVTLSLKNNQDELIIARTNWTPEYINELETKIDDAISNYLGLDKKKELRDATKSVGALISPAKRDLAFLKTQIEADFGEDAKTVLKVLGYEKYLAKVQKGDQESVIEMLYTFKKGMTEDLKSTMVLHGTNVILIERILDYTDRLKDANVTQEILKETTKEISQEALMTFNSIYNEIVGICKIAASYYQYDKLKKEQFTFSKVISNMKSSKNVKKVIVDQQDEQ